MDCRRTVGSTEWQIISVRSVGRPKRRWRDDNVEQQGGLDKDSKGQRKLEDSCGVGGGGGGEGGYFLQWMDTA